jgi:hypothetical protein
VKTATLDRRRAGPHNAIVRARLGFLLLAVMLLVCTAWRTNACDPAPGGSHTACAAVSPDPHTIHTHGLEAIPVATTTIDIVRLTIAPAVPATIARGALQAVAWPLATFHAARRIDPLPLFRTLPLLI